MENPPSNVVLLEGSVNPGDEASHFRILIDGKFIKYITIDAGVYTVEDMCFGPSFASLLPPFPTSNDDWNLARISQNRETGTGLVSTFSKLQLPGITTVWHPTKIDYLALRVKESLRSNVCVVTCPGFLDAPVIAKFARFHWEVPALEAETAAYSWIDGQEIGPDFLGHVTEEGRVIGFLVSRVADCRNAESEDLEACRSVLGKLHKLGIKHGDINKHNFLVHGGGEGKGKATLIDFDFASRQVSQDERDVEYRKLPDMLCDMSGMSGIPKMANSSCMN